jgi:hypothetical protein
MKDCATAKAETATTASYRRCAVQGSVPGEYDSALRGIPITASLECVEWGENPAWPFVRQLEDDAAAVAIAPAASSSRSCRPIEVSCSIDR